MFDKNDLSGIIGKNIVITYTNGWKYEVYVKNGQTMEYRMLIGQSGNMLLKNQQLLLVRIGKNIYKMSWMEPSGIYVCINVNMDEKENLVHCTALFPRWTVNRKEKTACFRNEHISLLESYRDTEPTYPIEVFNSFDTNAVVRDCGPDDDNVISCDASELPTDFS